MWQRSLGYYNSLGGGGSSTQNVTGIVANWVAAVVANGGTVSAGRQTLMTTFIQALISAGAWGVMDDAVMLVAENAGSALTSLKRLQLCTVTAAPTFTTDRGYAFNGTSQFLTWTGSAPGSSSHMDINNGRIGQYERTNVNANNTGISSSPTWLLRARGSTGVLAGVSNTAAAVALASNNSQGYTVASRAGGSTTMTVYKTGVSLGTATVTPNAVVSNQPYFVGARNNAGTADQFRANTVGYCDIGGPLNDTQELAVYTALQSFMTSVGANV